MLKDYLKPEYRNTFEADVVSAMFEVPNKDLRMTLKVPADVGDAITRWLKKAVKPEYSFHRRTGGRRNDLMNLTCLRKDAEYFKYYFNKKYPNQHRVHAHHCVTCGQRI